MDIQDTLVPGKVTLSIPNPVLDPKGQPTTLDGPPTWTVQPDQDNVTLDSVADDGFSATFHITDNVAATQVQVNADARQGPDVSTLTGTFVFNVTPGEATSLGEVTAGPVVPD